MKVDIEIIKKAINDEPELPVDMPDKLMDDFLVNLLKKTKTNTIRIFKDG